MKALKFLGSQKSKIIEIEIPISKAGELLIKVEVSALCGSEKTDYFKDEELTYISGHEYAGIVVDNNDCNFKNDDRVAVNVIKGCGKCYFCKNYQPQFCKTFEVYNGGHAEYVCVHQSCLIPLPDDINFHDAVLLGGDTAGVAFRAIQKFKSDLGNTVW